MKLKDRLLNKLADKLKKYGTPEYGYISSCDIEWEVNDNIFSNNEQNYYATELENSDTYNDDFSKDVIRENNLIQSKE